MFEMKSLNESPTTPQNPVSMIKNQPYRKQSSIRHASPSEFIALKFAQQDFGSGSNSSRGHKKTNSFQTQIRGKKTTNANSYEQRSRSVVQSGYLGGETTYSRDNQSVISRAMQTPIPLTENSIINYNTYDNTAMATVAHNLMPSIASTRNR